MIIQRVASNFRHGNHRINRMQELILICEVVDAMVQCLEHSPQSKTKNTI
eukprot:m.80642 g.80642  ORF g.80642 m.80642 type:complete len:50 (+) comp25331_c0_seq1:1755-1904(+)